MNLYSHWTWSIAKCYEDDVTSATSTGNMHLVLAVDNPMYVKPDIWTENSEYKWISDDASYLPLASDFVLRAGEYFFSALCSRHSSHRIAEHAGKRTLSRRWLGTWQTVGWPSTSPDFNPREFLEVWPNAEKLSGLHILNVISKRVLGIRPTCFTQP